MVQWDFCILFANDLNLEIERSETMLDIAPSALEIDSLCLISTSLSQAGIFQINGGLVWTRRYLLSQACFDKPMRSISLLKKHALILELKKKKNDVFCFLFLFLSANVNRWVPSWRPIWSEAQGSNVNYGKSLNTEETFKLIYDSKQKKKLLKKNE